MLATHPCCRFAALSRGLPACKGLCQSGMVQPGRLRQGPSGAQHHPTALAKTAILEMANACSIRPPATWASPMPRSARRWASRSPWRSLPAPAPSGSPSCGALGAEFILTDPLEGSDGAILMARQLAAENPDLYWYANQYNNPPTGRRITSPPGLRSCARR
jgi:hypothetical protein